MTNFYGATVKIRRLKKEDIVRLLIQGCLQHDGDHMSKTHWMRMGFPYHIDVTMQSWDAPTQTETLRCESCGNVAEVQTMRHHLGTALTNDHDRYVEAEDITEYCRIVAELHGIRELEAVDVKL